MQAGRELVLMHGVSAGIANAIAGKTDNAVKHAINNMRREAFPVRYD